MLTREVKTTQKDVKSMEPCPRVLMALEYPYAEFIHRFGNFIAALRTEAQGVHRPHFLSSLLTGFWVTLSSVSSVLFSPLSTIYTLCLNTFILCIYLYILDGWLDGWREQLHPKASLCPYIFLNFS